MSIFMKLIIRYQGCDEVIQEMRGAIRGIFPGGHADEEEWSGRIQQS